MRYLSVSCHCGRLREEVRKGSKKNFLVRLLIKKCQTQFDNAQTLMLDAKIAPAEYTNIKNTLRAEIEAQERRKMELVTDYGE
ncbi:hypothetical protein [Chitinophaga flava]|uniref:Uncharacterized protein n=1 Tax=Chitinophaga flava TaxID=2259036 RepID=A0A365XXD5_9BACT|nr:hypothetical protein [Chitinophaga flava]RBL91049.1 hypothetical protein DF182_00035 [Chitinophaga flava]